MRKSLRLRLLVGAALWISAALIVAGLAIAALLRDFVERTFDERLNATLVAVISAVSFDDSGSLVEDDIAAEPAYSQPFSGWYWQIADGRSILLRSSSLWDQGFSVDVGRAGDRTRLDALSGPNGETLHAVIRDFTAPGATDTLRVTVAGPSSQIEEALTEIIPPLLLSLVALGFGLVVAVLLQTVLGLRPLDRLRQNLAEVRGGTAARVSDAGYAELQPVIGELNALIDHNRAVIERARTHVGNLAHGLKTPLAILANEAGRAGDELVAESVARMERLVQHHLRRARSAASLDVIGVSTPVASVLDDLAFAMERIYEARGLVISIDCDATLVFAGERHDLEEMLGNLFDNACKWASRNVAISALQKARELAITVADDGPGVSPENREDALKRGFRLDESEQGSGFGLAIVRDLAALYGGRLELAESPNGGLEVLLVLPAA